MPKNTDFCKIVATIGPDTSDEKSIESLVKAGVSVFRCNCSHGSLPEYQERVTNIRKMEKNTTALWVSCLTCKARNSALARLKITAST